MLSQNELQRFPPLPQYGKPVACCQGGLSEGKWGRILAIAMCALCSIPLVAFGLASAPLDFKEGAGRWVAIALMVVVPIATAYLAAMTLEVSFKKSPLYVFEGGIHFGERVRYMIGTNSLVTFYSGVREVSLPWRVLEQFRLNKSRVGENFIASFKIPDGRTMQIETADGESEAIAVKTIVEKMKPRSVS